MGLAKDGHIIVGPYNKDGELWSCQEHDICNGVFLDDNSYAYAMTYTFPYVVGCWGPGPAIEWAPTCTGNGCGAISGSSTPGTTEGTDDNGETSAIKSIAASLSAAAVAAAALNF